jgi:cell wall-associated NlpC family hydrolase
MYYIDLLGKRFEYGANGPEAYDCKSLIVKLYKRQGIQFPNYNSSDDPAIQSESFAEGLAKYAIKLDKPEAACMVMFQIVSPYVSHVGMMLDEVRFIHITKGTKVSVERIDSLTWERKLKGFYRLKV